MFDLIAKDFQKQAKAELARRKRALDDAERIKKRGDPRPIEKIVEKELER